MSFPAGLRTVVFTSIRQLAMARSPALESRKPAPAKTGQNSMAESTGNSAIEFCPVFAGAGFLDSSAGDLAIANCLIEVKTTVRKPAGKDIRQLIVYAALDANTEERRWS